MIYKRVTEYTVCALPDTDRRVGTFALTVRQIPGGKWVVWLNRLLDRAFVGNDNTVWHGSYPEELDPDRYHHDLETALRLAEAAAPDVEVNGVRAGDLT